MALGDSRSLEGADSRSAVLTFFKDIDIVGGQVVM